MTVDPHDPGDIRAQKTPFGVTGGRTTAVMVGFDGSPSSHHALAYAAGLSRRLRGALLVAYIAPIPVAPGLGTIGADVPME
jgi:universal stress protein family protein